MVSFKFGLKTLVMVIITAGFLDASPLQDANKVSDDSTYSSKSLQSDNYSQKIGFFNFKIFKMVIL
jgi:hypothetical protein